MSLFSGGKRLTSDSMFEEIRFIGRIIDRKCVNYLRDMVRAPLLKDYRHINTLSMLKLKNVSLLI